MKILLIFYYYNFLYKATTIKVIMPIVLGNSNISYKENKSSINPYNALLFKNQKVGIGVDINSVLNHSLEVNGDINISSNSKYIINNANFGYSNLDHKLSAGTNISIDADFKINNTYTLPIASSSVIGGIRVGSNLSIDANGFLSTPSYTLQIASGAVMGGVRVGNNLSIDANGILSTPIPTLYILPTASDTVIGGVRVGTNLSIDANGFLSTHVPYTLPTASSSVIGGVKVGSNLSIDASGILSAPTPYTLPTSSVSIIGGVKVGNNLSIDANGILSAPTPYTLPTSSEYVIGGVKVGSNLSIDANGFLSTPSYTLPTSSVSIIGGVKVGSNLSIDANGILSAPPPYTLPTAPTATIAFTATFSDNSPSTHEPIGTNERYMIFTTTDINYTFTVPNGGINCDILLVGGGGGGGNHGGAGGGGDVIYKTNVTLPAGNCVVFVGNGGNGGIGDYNRGGDGYTSSITSTNASFISLFAAGGGGGGSYNQTPGTTPTAGSVIDGNYSSGGGGGGGAGGIGGGNSGGTGNSVSGNGGSNNSQNKGGGGGGAVGNGLDASDSGAGNGGSGLSSTIIGTVSTYGGGGGGGTWSGGTGGSGVDNGGNGGAYLVYQVAGTANSGGGGGGGGHWATNNNGVAGGSGIVIIRYRAFIYSTFIGGIRVGNNLSITGGVLSAPTPYTLPTASSSAIGGIRVGSNLSIDAGGILSTHTPYTLPTASDTIIGSVKVDGTTIAINTGVISYTGGIAQWGTSGNNIHNTNTLNVGIGTTNPQSRLHIYNNISGSTSLNINNIGTGSSVIELRKGDVDDAYSDFKIGNYDGDFFVKSSINGIDSDYIKMLGTNGAIYNFNNSLNWTQTSDRRIKENIEIASYDKCYENIDKLELNSFNYIKEFKTGNQDTNQLGFIAQEIEDIFPKSVFTNSYNSDELNIPDMLSIDIGQINYALYGAAKKLIKMNNDKELRLKRLEKILDIRRETHSNLRN
jgi:small basic protein